MEIILSELKSVFLVNLKKVASMINQINKKNKLYKSPSPWPNVKIPIRHNAMTKMQQTPENIVKILIVFVIVN